MKTHSQAIAYVLDAVPSGTGTRGLQSLGIAGPAPRGEHWGRGAYGTPGLEALGMAGQATHLALVPLANGTPTTGKPTPTSVSLFDQGVVQVLEAAVTGLAPMHPDVLALSNDPKGGGALEPLEEFTTNQAGAAIVNTVGPIRQIVQGEGNVPRRYLVIVPGTAAQHGPPVQVQR